MAAPKPMLFINGTKDHLFPVRGVNKAFEIMHDTWRKMGADDCLSTQIWEIPHSCGVQVQEETLNFFEKNLKRKR